jgi:hypothetical protein
LVGLSDPANGRRFSPKPSLIECIAKTGGGIRLKNFTEEFSVKCSGKPRQSRICGRDRASQQ